MSITGKDLIKMGYAPAPWFSRVIKHAVDIADAKRLAEQEIAMIPKKIAMQEPVAYSVFMEPDSHEEKENLASVVRTMDILVRTPTVRSAYVMPDACPAGPDGTIPVGGVVETENAIHPGMHSADICCSLMLTEFEGASPAEVLDAIHEVTHFGPGGRHKPFSIGMSLGLVNKIWNNKFLEDKKSVEFAIKHFATQGDGNHFSYVGVRKSTGRTVLVTHHGSRGFGALLYKRGMRLAEKFRKEICPDVLKQNAWIPADTWEGVQYWRALQVVREWTKQSHQALHTLVGVRTGATAVDNFWNEHNFVFRDGDRFWHAKGATPVWSEFLPDTNGLQTVPLQIVPMNMAEPILLINGEDGGVGFAPHGAGRNMSRTAHKGLQVGSDAEVFEHETAGIDARFWCGEIDTSELPSAYKSADKVRSDMHGFGLARVIDEVMPYGSIMAGDVMKNAPWRK